MALSPDLLNILACPKCKGEVRIDADQTGLVCAPCKLRYLIKDDIPIMLIDEAEKLP
ncbi:MAG: Trm112 family protein [Candidatus Binataceae bacterium]|jgi:uncharacterized protein YbaR (Trm112 family)